MRSLSTARSSGVWLGAALGLSFCAACAEPAAPLEVLEVEPGDASDDSIVDGVPDAAAADLELVLAAEVPYAAAGEPVTVTVKLRNRSGRRVRLLERNTALGVLRNDLFHVVVDGRAVRYVGRHYKWAPPQPEDYVLLERGQEHVATVELSSSYDFSTSGLYTIYALPYGVDRSSGPVDVVSSVSVQVEGRPLPTPPSTGLEPTSRSRTQGCSASQVGQLAVAYAAARKLASMSLTYLLRTEPAPTARFTTWFGAFSAGRWGKVKEHFTSLTQHLASESADCSCTDSAYSYVLPTQPHRIYLCNAFWQAPLTGHDSMPGALLRAMSHFDDVTGATSWADGDLACKRLAKQAPDRAVVNADSHQYFAENSAALQ